MPKRVSATGRISANRNSADRKTTGRKTTGRKTTGRKTTGFAAFCLSAISSIMVSCMLKHGVVRLNIEVQHKLP
jgi:hypothetical protein